MPLSGGYWLPIHTGLLRDERWADMSIDQRGVWITLFLLLDGEPTVGWFKDVGRVVWLLRREGMDERDARGVASELEAAGWIVPEHDDSPRVTLRGWHEYTDDTNRHKVRNRVRGDRSEENKKTTARRRAKRLQERTGADRSPRQDKMSSPPARESAGAGRGGEVVSLREGLIAAGLDPEIIGKRRATRVDGQP